MRLGRPALGLAHNLSVPEVLDFDESKQRKT